MTIIGHDVEIDWYKSFGWECPCCGGEIKLLYQGEAKGHSDGWHKCHEPKGEMCKRAYLMVRWSQTERDGNGDALILKRWIKVQVDEQHVNNINSLQNSQLVLIKGVVYEMRD